MEALHTTILPDYSYGQGITDDTLPKSTDTRFKIEGRLGHASARATCHTISLPSRPVSYTHLHTRGSVLLVMLEFVRVHWPSQRNY